MSGSVEVQSEEAVASNVAYSYAHYGTLPDNATVDGMTVVYKSATSQFSQGFAAVEVEDAQGNIIIGFAGTLPSTNAYGLGSLGADLKIEQSEPIADIDALSDAQDFALDAAGDVDGSGKVYVAGHSLGGTEAEAAAQALVENNPTAFGGGSTWGATGLPGNLQQGGPPTLVNYFEYGDLVAAWASDSTSPLRTPFKTLVRRGIADS